MVPSLVSITAEYVAFASMHTGGAASKLRTREDDPSMAGHGTGARPLALTVVGVPVLGGVLPAVVSAPSVASEAAVLLALSVTVVLWGAAVLSPPAVSSATVSDAFV